MNSPRTSWFASILGALLAFSVTPRAADLIHRYDFNGAAVTDLIGGGAGALQGDAAVRAGVLNLDGDGDYAEFATSVIPAAGTWSVTFFARQTSAQAGVAAMIISGGPGFYVGHGADGNLRFGDANPSTGLAFPADNGVHHYAWVQGAGGGTFYLDGVAAGSFAGMTASGATRLGRQHGGGLDYFRGTVDDLRVYAGVLTAEEVAAIAGGAEPPAGPCLAPPAGLISWYRGESAANDNLGAHHGLIEGGVAFTGARVGSGMQFNGSDSAVNLGSWFDRQAFTLAFWARPAATQVSHADILDNNHTASRSWVLQQDAGNINRYVWGGSDGAAGLVFDLPANVWSFVVVTRDASHVTRVYLNGDLHASAAGAGPIPYDGTQTLRLGRWGGGGRHWNGVLDEVDIYERPLAAAEVLALYAAGAAGKCVPPEAGPGVPYFTDFEAGIGSEWWIPQVETAGQANFSRFTGRFNNHSQTLTLGGFSPGQSYTVVFDFYAIDSWDGNSGAGDRFQVLVDGQLLFNETFGGAGNQSYPGEPDSGRVQLGFNGSYTDAIYRNVTISFVPAGSTAQLTFRGANLQAVDDESWGVDNVNVRLTSDYATPFVTGTSLPAAGSTSEAAIDRFQVYTSRGLDLAQAVEPGHYLLREAGANGELGDGDDFLLDMAPSLVSSRSVAFAFNDAPLQPGRYRFELRNTLRDAEGTAFTPFSREFVVAHPLLGRIENTFNNQLETATTLTPLETPPASGFYTAVGVGSFPAGGDTDYWRFTAEAGDRVTVWIEADAGNVYPQISLRNAANTALASSGEWQSTYNYVQDLTIPVPGDYYVAVASNSNRSPGRYGLRLEVTRGPQLEAEDNNNQSQANTMRVSVTPGVFRARAAGALTWADGGSDYFRLPMMNVGNTISVGLALPMGSSLATNDVILTLEPEGGGAVATNRTGLLNHIVASDGVYYVRVRTERPGWRAQYLVEVTVADGTRPVITSVSLPEEGASDSGVIERFTVGFSEDMTAAIGRVGLPFRTYGGHTYVTTSGSMSWPQAEAQALGYGGHLVAVNDAAENEMLLNEFGAYASFWIGFSDQALEGTWVWSTGEEVTFTAWNGGEPNNSGNEDFAEFLGSGRWNDIGGGNRWGVIELAGATDGDGDGIPDGLDAFPQDPLNGFDLRAAGADGQFGTGDDQVYRLRSTGYSSGLSATFRVVDGPLQPGNYRLTINTWVTDRAGNGLAADVVRHFSMQAVPNFVLENRENQARANATSLSSAPGAASDGSWTGLTSYGVGAHPYFVQAVDLNRDGALDALSCDYTDSAIRVGLGDGRGGFTNITRYAAAGNPIASAVADVNGDGWPEVITANYQGHTLGVFFPQGGGYGDMVALPVGNHPRSVVAADFNGDSKIDLATACWGSDQVSVLLGNGDGTFAAAVHYPSGSGTASVEVGDLNGDGRLDVLVANYNSGAVSVLLGDGAGGLAGPVSYGVGANPRWARFGHLNGDGRLDAVALNAGDNSVSVLLGQADGTLGAQAAYPSGCSDAYGLTLHDMNGDGLLDVLVAGYGNSRVGYFRGAGDGSLLPVVTSGFTGNPISVAAGDFTGDGIQDVVMALHTSYAVLLARGNNTEFLVESPAGSGLRSGAGRGMLSDRGDWDYWSFTAEAGDILVVAVEIPGSPGASQLFYRIEYPDGNELTSFYATSYNGWGQSSPITIANAGTYFLRVSYTYDYFAEYRLRVTLARPALQPETEDNNNPGQADPLGYALTDHTRAATAFGYVGVYDVYGDFFALGNLAAGTTVRLQARQPGTSGLVPFLSVHRSDGVAVARSLPGQAQLEHALVAGEEGAYYARLNAVRPGAVQFDGVNDRINGGTWTPGSLWTVEAWVKPSAAPAGRRTIAGVFNSCRDWGITMHDGQFGAAIRPPGGCSATLASGEPVVLDQWYHVLATCDGTTAQFYVNGVLKASGPVDPDYVGEQSYFVIGSEACCGGNSFPGLIDNVRVWDRPLGEAEVAAYAADANLRLTGAEPGLVGYWPFDEGWGSIAFDYSPMQRHAGLENGAAWAPDAPAPPTPSLLSQYLLDVEIEDGAAPAILADSLPAEGSTTPGIVDRFTLGFSEDMMASTVNDSASYELRSAGADGNFGTADDALYTVVSAGYASGLVGTYVVGDGPLQPGVYRFTAQTSLQDRGGNGLAAAYVRGFTVEGVVGFALENRANDAAYGASSLASTRLPTPDGSHSVRGTTGVGNNPYHLVSADLNGDGRADLVTPNISSDNISVLLGLGDGTFQAQVPYGAGNGPIAVAVGDLNGDGKLDVVSANYYGHSITVFLGNGDGTLQAGVTTACGNNPRQLRLADVNADTALDVVTANSGSNNTSVFLGNGDGTLAPRADYPAAGGTFGVAVADLNGDTHLDLVTANAGADSISFLAGAGDGSFGAPVHYPAGDQPREVVLGDMDGDGRLDAVTLDAGANTVSVLRGLAGGGFAAAEAYPTGGSDPYHMILCNLNGDARPDVGVGSYGSNQLITFVNRGDGTLEPAVRYHTTGNPIAVAAADFNGDGREDLATANYGNHTVSVWLGHDTELLAEDPAGSGLRTGTGRGNIASRQDLDFWSVTGNAGDRLSVAIEVPGAPSSSGLYLRVEYPDGRVLTEFGAGSTGWGESAPVVLPARGTYLVRVSYNWDYYAEYRLRLTLVPDPVQVETEDNGSVGAADQPVLTLDGNRQEATVFGYCSLGDAAGDYYRLGNLAEGTTIALTLRQPASSPLVPVLAIYRSNGDLAASSPPGTTDLSYDLGVGGADVYFARVYPEGATTGLMSQYLLDLEVADTRAPVITSVSLPEAGASTAGLWDGFSLGFSEDMTAATVNDAGNYDLRSAGGDGQFDTADDEVYAVLSTGYASGLAAAYSIGGAPLQAGSYRFTAKTGLQDRASNGLAAPFVRLFTVVGVAGWITENRQNDVLNGATSLSLSRQPSPDGSVTDVATFGVGTNPYFVAAGDLDGDGRLDLVTANISSDNVSVLLGQGNGQFASQVPYAAGNGPIAVAVGDLNGDGKLDVASANYYGHRAGVLLGNGDGTLQAAVQLVVPNNPRSVRIADLNGDAKLDLVTANMGGDNVSVLLGNGDGTFQARADYAVGNSPYAVAVGDLNGDGRPDLVAATAGTDRASVLLGNGDGTFGAAVHYEVQDQPRDVALGDLDGDGRLDAVLLNAGSHSVSVLRGTGDGTLLPAVHYPTGGNDEYHLIAFALNGDARPDVAVASYGSSQLILFANLGDGTLGQRLNFGLGGNPIGVVAGDFNGDAIQDLATANYGSGSVTVWLGNDTQPLAEDPAGSGVRSSFARGNLSSRSDVDYWGFSALANDRLWLAVDTVGNPVNSGLRYRLEYSDGTELTTFNAERNGYGQSSPVVVPATGTYRVRVSYNYDYWGEYRLRVTLARPPWQFEVENNNNVGQANLPAFTLSGRTRTAALFGDYHPFDRTGDYYQLGNLAAGTAVRAVHRQPAHAGYHKSMVILDAAGGVLASSLPGASTLEFAVPADGSYYVAQNYLFATGPRHPGGSAHSLSFDGADDYVSVPLNVPEDAMTVSLWFRTVNPNVGLFSVQGGGHDRHLYLTGGNIACRVYSAGAFASEGLNLTDGLWHQVVMTFGAAVGGTRVYVDGVLAASNTKANSDFTWQTAVYFGFSDDAPQPYFDGVMDDVRIWDRAFTAEEVTANFGNTLVGNEPGLIGWWPLNEAVGTVAADGSAGGHPGTLNNGPTWVGEGVANSVPRGLFATYLLDLELTDNAAPRITSVSLPGEESTTTFVWPHFTVGFSEDMNPSAVNQAGNYELRGDGADNLWGTADDALYTVSSDGYVRGLSASYSIADGPLQPDRYRFTIRPALQDVFGNPLAAPYERTFVVVELPLYALESRQNQTPGLGTSLSRQPTAQPSGSLGAGGSTAVGARPYVLAAGRLNADAHLDLVSANYNGDNLSVLLGNGDGTFQPAVNYASGNGALYVVLADVNKDTHLDALVANYAGDRLSVFPGVGDGTFGPKTDYVTPDEPNAVQAIDLNGDGWLDVVTANRGGASVSVFLNQGDGTLAARTDYPAGTGAARLALGQFNADAHTDIAVVNYTGNADSTYSILLGNGDGTFQGVQSTPVGRGPYDITLADLNGDSRPDLVIAFIFEDGLAWVPGNGDGTFGAAVKWASGGSQPHWVQMADVNLDGELDAVVANYNSSRMSVHLGLGLGSFQPPQNYPSGGNALGTAVGDFNGDGRPDIAVANYTHDNVSIFLGDPTEPLAEDAVGGVLIGAGRGHLYDSADVDYFRFSGRQGDVMVLGAEIPGSPGSSSLSYTVYRPDGGVLIDFNAAGNGWGQSAPVTLPLDGTYSVRVSRNQNYYGEYRFRVYSVRPPSVLEGEDNNAIAQASLLPLRVEGDTSLGSAFGYIRFNGDLDYFNLGTVTSGSTVYLNARPTAGSPLAPIVSLYDASNGYMIEAGGGRAFDGVAEVRITRTGTYFALVRGPDGTTGLDSSYRLDVQVVPTGSVSFPNLLVTAVTPPGGGILSGQTVSFAFTVQNVGAAGTGGSGWLDRVVMTANQIVGDADDLQLNVVPRVGGLASGATYDVNASGAIPDGVAGAYYLAVQTDFGNAVNEFVLEGDNTSFSETTFTVTRPPYADLKVEELTVTGPSAANEYTITWTTANRGDAPANGGFTERLLVRNQTTSLVLVNADRPVSQDLAPGETVAQSAVVTAVAAGQYQVIVLTDVTDRFFEFDANGHLSAEQNRGEAGFQITQFFAVTLAANPVGGGQVTGGGSFAVGSVVTVSAVPDTSVLPYRFQNWTEGGVFQSAQADYTFVVARGRALTANFTLPLYQIAAGNNPAAGGQVTGAGSYFHGANVTLRAVPAQGYKFEHWTEGGTPVSAEATYTFAALGNRSLVANYAEANVFHVVTLRTEPPGLVAIPGDGTYNNGQSLLIQAPATITNPPSLYTFRHLRQDSTVIATTPAYTKTFTTVDPTNVTFTAVYDVRSIAPVVTNVLGGVTNAALGRLVAVNLVPLSSNFQVRLQFDRSMDPGVEPQITISNITAGAVQAIVPSGGIWLQTVTPNDTYVSRAIAFAAGMDGQHEFWAAGARDPEGVALESARVLAVTVDVTLPPNPVLALGSMNNSSATVTWNNYAPPADLNGFRIYLRDTTFTSVEALTPLTRLGAGARSHTYGGLEVDRDYFAAVVAVDNAGNADPSVTAFPVRLTSTVPPPVIVQVAPTGADSARVSWEGYDTSALIGFTGFRLYAQESAFGSVAGLTAAGTFGAGVRSADISGLDRTRTYHFAVVGYNRNNEFNPNVTTGVWSDPFGGAMRVDTVMGGPGQEIEIFQAITVTDNATLTIRAGTKLRFPPGAGLRVEQGRLVVEGTALDPVVFTSYFDNTLGDTPAPGDWEGVVLEPGAAGSAVRHLFVQYGRGLTVNGAAVTLEAFTAQRNLGPGLTLAQGAVLATADALLTLNETGVRQTDTARLTLSHSVIKNNTTNARGEGTNPLVAAGNWWGTPNEPEILARVTGLVNVSNPLGQEPILTPAIGTVDGQTTVGRRDVTLRLASRTAAEMRVSEDSAYPGVFFEPFAATRAFLLSEGGGPKVLFAQFRSITGEANTPVTLALTYITAGPVIQGFSLSEGQVLQRPVTVTGQATAPLGMQAVEFHVDGIPQAIQVGGNLSHRFDVRLLANGVHRVKLLARDQSGNIATVERNVLLDVTPPPAPVITSPAGDGVVTNPMLVVAGNAEPLVPVRLTRNGLTVATATATAVGKINFPDVPLVEGVNELVAVAFDAVGTTPSAPRQMVLDSGAPAALVLDGPVYRPTAGLDFNWRYAPEGERAARFRLLWHTSVFATPGEATGQSPLLDRMMFTVPGIPNGAYFFAVVGYDAAGNVSPLSNLVPFTFDGTGPAFQASFNKPSPVGVGDLVITLAANEALAATPDLVIRPSGGRPVSVNLTPGPNNVFTGTLAVTPEMSSGLARLAVSARDAVGNEFNGAPAGAELMLDTTPPAGRIVTSPVAPVQTLSPADVTVTLTLTEAAKAGTPPSLSFTPPVGDPLTMVLTGSDINWVGTLSLGPAQGSGQGAFVLDVQDAVGNRGTTLLAGGTLEIYNTLVPSAPEEPTGLIAQSLAGGGVRVAWNAVANAEIYRLFREPGADGDPTVVVQDNLTSIVVTNTPDADGTYRFAVAASRRGADSTHTNAVTAISDRTPPPVPTGVQAQLAASGVRVTWTQGAGEVPRSYRVYRNDVLIRTVSSVTAVSDSPPRGVASYVVAAVDDVGNESRSEPVVIELLVGAVSDLTVLVNAGQAPAMSWTSSDATATGFNVYRNGVRLNAAPLTETSFTDVSYAGFGVTQYGVRAVNAAGQESPARAVDIYRVDLGLLANPTAGASSPLVTRYFDVLQVSVANRTAGGDLPLRQLELRRVVGPAEANTIQHIGLELAAGASLTRDLVLPSALTFAAQTFRARAVQETDLGGSSVIYQQIFDFRGAVAASLMAEIVAVEQPLAGGLAAFDVRVHNRGFADMDVILTRNSGRDPGDIYVSVKNGQGEEVSRGYFNGGLPGMLFLPDGTGFMRVRPGASVRVVVPNVLVPEALASAPAVTFEGGTDKIYWHFGGPEQLASGPVTGAMNTSLRQTDYYGTLQTDRQLYSNETPVLITGQALARATGQPVPNAPLKIGFTTRGFTWYRETTTDAEGNYSYTYLPAAGLSGTFTLWAAHPDVYDRLNQAEMTLYRLYANPPRGDIRMSKNDTLDFSINLINPGDLNLANVATTFRAYVMSGGEQVPITTVQGQNLTEGPINLGARETRGLRLHLHADIDAPDSCVVEFTMTSAEGAAATFVGNVSLLPAVPVLTVTDPRSGYVEVSLNRGALLSRTVTIENRGLRDLQGVEVLAPAAIPWMQVNLAPAADGKIRLPDIPVGGSVNLTVVFTPPEDAALDYFHDVINIRGSNTPQVFKVDLYALVTSAERGAVQFYVDNVLGQEVPNATVRLRSTHLQTELPPVQTDEQGIVTVNELHEGHWSWQVTAPGHSSTVGTVEIIPDQIVQVSTRLSKSVVTVTFRVEPVPYTDRYEIKIEQTFETHVPAPVLVLNPVSLTFDNVVAGFETNFVVTGKNHGLIEMTDVEIHPASVGGGRLIPLITYFPLLRPQETIEIPYRAVYLGEISEGGGGLAAGGSGGGKARLSQTAAAAKFGGKEGAQFDPNAFADCATGGFVGLAEAVIALNSLINAQYRCISDASLVRTAQGILVAFSLYQAVSMMANPISFFGNLASCFLQQMLGGLFGGGGGNGPGAGNGPGQRSLSDYNFVGPECFAPGTRVLMGDGTPRPIEEIRVNDVVRSGRRPGDVATVTEVYARTVRHTRLLRYAVLRGGGAEDELVTTDEHLFWVDGKGWAEARTLRPGDWLVTADGRRAEIAANETRAGPSRVHTFKTKEDHAFYANGVLVHDLCGRWEDVSRRRAPAAQEVQP